MSTVYWQWSDIKSIKKKWNFCIAIQSDTPTQYGIKNLCLILCLIIDGIDTNIYNLKHCDPNIGG